MSATLSEIQKPRGPALLWEPGMPESQKVKMETTEDKKRRYISGVSQPDEQGLAGDESRILEEVPKR